MDGAELGWELSTAVVLFHEAVARRLGLSAVDHKALGLITRRGPLPAGALAAELGIGASAVTALVDRLARAGYVRRVTDPGDRRRVLVSADTGHVPDLSDIFAALGRDMSAFMADYDEREIAAITDYVTRTVAVLKAHTARLASPGQD
ncbi:putative HTH-type transcriptional regulator YcgE [Microtetraspora sp. NBRC 13810]|uniref:MarR family winged helix-turn-helix transcriptional regulator n=1 Tax=Microtetraspora sp. NBRC 13810 TaxID=3030990 RepID=UPI0024A0ED26|nr:MarR family transcriptional regulator [Microtetraspora sp. NBRC 13810]GLW05403.1 putative HTH-type transcriptional regulator YcgE [Microtetraspora sp. NBRC 13810]